MKRLVQMISLITLTTASALAEEKPSIEPIVQFPLNPAVAVTIYCNQMDTGVTTVSFPSKIDSITASKVATSIDKDSPQPFLLGFTEGNSYFSLKALGGEGTRGALNVRFNGHTYIFNLDTVKSGHRSITMSIGKRGGHYGTGTAVKTNPKILLSLMDKAKAYHLFAKEYPEQIADLGYSLQNKNIEYSNFDILLKEVVRYPRYDTLVFHCQLKNKLSRELLYNPRDFSVNVGHKTFNSAISDASGKIPPKGVTTVYFAITGTPTGGRNNLDPENDWYVLLPVTETPKFLEKVSAPSEPPQSIINTSEPEPSMIEAPKPKSITTESP